jgi:phosphoribosylformylglycinamidine cyclo-ligase
MSCLSPFDASRFSGYNVPVAICREAIEMPEEPVTYRQAGVDIDAAHAALLRMKELIRATQTPEVLADVGAFGGMFQLDISRYRQPVLVSSVDGVGTKLKVAFMMGRHDTVGHDLVNHCVNDILVQGAQPLFFLDYFATGKLQPEVLVEVVKGLSEACQEAGCALLGGETAEMPGMYADGEYDLAGTIVGIVERDAIIDGSRVQPGDAVIGLASNGLHTNGYSLARYVLFELAGMRADSYVPELGTSLGEELLRPHRCYLRPITAALQQFDIHAMAHITGGGFYDNIPRVLPSDCRVIIDRRSWEVPFIFRLIQEKGNVPDPEMFRTFNMGIGMVVIVPREQSLALVEFLQVQGEGAALIGEVQRGGHDVQIM